MMSDKSLPTFRPIAAPLDVDDAALDRINRQLGVPTLTKPAAELAARHAADRSRADAISIARAQLEKLTIELPAYLTDAMKRKALDERTTVRHVVMLALKNAGFEVVPEDLVEDGRRRKAR